MARRVKVITIEGLGEVTVKEVSPRGVYKAMDAGNKMAEVLTLAEDCLSLTREQLTGLYASEIEQILDAVMEVNGSFLSIAGKLGVRNVLEEMLNEIGKTLPAAFADSYRQVMAKLPGTMAGAAS